MAAENGIPRVGFNMPHPGHVDASDRPASETPTRGAQVVQPERPADEVVLLDDAGRPIGTADRVGVHTDRTPLHLAFSTYLFDPDGHVLLTRRALNKRTWPGVWTNTCCGHPRPGEPLAHAASRRIGEELGIKVAEADLTCVAEDFRYVATDAGGLVENELCPVFVARVPDRSVHPDPREVAGTEWVPWEQARERAHDTPERLSPWAALQIPLVAAALAEGTRW